MAAASGIRMGKVFVEIGADPSKFFAAVGKLNKSIGKIGSSMQSFGTKMTALGGAVVAPMFASAMAFANVGSALNDMSKRTGVATEALSVLQFAAEQTGTDMGSVEGALKKMQKAIFAASDGSKEAADALAMVGLTASDLAGLSADEQMGKIADGLMAIQDPGVRAAVAMQIFGKSGTAILPMLEGGAAGMAAFADEAKRLGLVMDSETAAKADALGDAVDSLKASMKMAFIQVGSAIAPILTELARNLAMISASVGVFIRDNQEMVVAAAGSAVKFTALGVAIYAVGKALALLSGGLAILLSPIGALAAVIGVVAVKSGFAEGAMNDLSATAKSVGGSIVEALAAGDFAKAWIYAIAAVEEALLRMRRTFDKTIQRPINLTAIKVAAAPRFSELMDQINPGVKAWQFGAGENEKRRAQVATQLADASNEQQFIAARDLANAEIATAQAEGNEQIAAGFKSLIEDVRQQLVQVGEIGDGSLERGLAEIRARAESRIAELDAQRARESRDTNIFRAQADDVIAQAGMAPTMDAMRALSEEFHALAATGKLSTDQLKKYADAVDVSTDRLSENTSVANAGPGVNVLRPRREEDAMNWQAGDLLGNIRKAKTSEDLLGLMDEFDALKQFGRLTGDQESDIGNAISQASAMILGQERQSPAEVAGTFSSMALGGLGFGGSLAVQQLAEQKETNKILRERLAVGEVAA